MMGRTAIVLALALAAACGGKKKETPGPAARDAGGAPAATISRDVGRCLGTLERAVALPADERAGTIVRGCALCAASWDPVIAADRADTGTPVDYQAVAAAVAGCGGFCTNQATAEFKQHLGELMAGKPTTRPWKTLAATCAAAMRADDRAQRFASGAWFALASINRRLVELRAQLPPTELARLDAALASMYLALPPHSAPGTAFVVPGGAQRPGTPWRHVTVTPDGTFVGRLAFTRLTPDGLTLDDGGAPYPGTRLDSLAALPAALDATAAPTAAPPPGVPGRIDEPVLIAPRAAAARIVTEAMSVLGGQRAYLAVAAPAPAALWRGLIAAHPLPLAAPVAAPAGPRLRFSLGAARVAVIGGDGAVLASAPLPAPDLTVPERWRAAAIALARGHTIEITAAEGEVDDLAALLDAAAAGGAVLAIPAPRGAAPAGRDLPAFDAARLASLLGPPPPASTPSPTRPPP